MYRSGMYRCGTLLTRTEVVHVPKWSKFRICGKSCTEVVCTEMVTYRSGPNPIIITNTWSLFTRIQNAILTAIFQVYMYMS